MGLPIVAPGGGIDCVAIFPFVALQTRRTEAILTCEVTAVLAHSIPSPAVVPNACLRNSRVCGVPREEFRSLPIIGMTFAIAIAPYNFGLIFLHDII